MHIAINAAYRLHGGGFTHLRQLLDAWLRLRVDCVHTISLFTRPENVGLLQGSLSQNMQVHTVGQPSMSLAAKLAWEQFVFPRLLATANPDALLCTGSIAPMRSPVPTVVVLH